MKKNIVGILAGCSLLMLSGCQVMSGERSVNQYSSDAAITTSVKAALVNNSGLPASRIHVETDKGTVLLSGFVKTYQQKIKAGQMASQIEGVRVVQNNLIVRK
ncbi:phospholipid binding protein [Legionella beliardensis]|uniref:Phospholipid binding protein n=1 Tax=Legionella beliardensis TaxID=91822 RepID=A0A378I5X6_9GAMM|nr:BON domain-containing protein [Legionella beliardensis]STX30061.1 phospholipid binding protein [Legionella beliardensis]